MKTYGFYLGTALMLVICFCAIVPAQAAEPADQAAYVRGNAMAGGMFGYFSDEIRSLSQDGYDVTAMQASLDTAKTAAQSSDRNRTKAAVNELRKQIKDAVQSGKVTDERLKQYRESVQTRIRNVAEDGKVSAERLDQQRKTVQARISTANTA